MSKPSSLDTPASTMRNPGDEAAPGAPQTGEITCPVCHGSGKTADRNPCMHCGGTGMVVVTVGDA
ncbi:MAG TPA: hypothetical protein VGE12_22960 [Noviherbaspirillum sp.]